MSFLFDCFNKTQGIDHDHRLKTHHCSTFNALTEPSP